MPVRLHSACLTGDVFGSRRCDCGDQLRLALPQLEQQGGGIILYLEQEGRGLGLANKIRTYQLQDAGLDTVDANTVLGFDDDERDYGVAVRMLQMLGCTRVRLLTNNPAKLEGLSHAGIDVSGRVPLQGPINSDNRRYLTAKATRAGHKLDHVLGVLRRGRRKPAIGDHRGDPMEAGGCGDDRRIANCPRLRSRPIPSPPACCIGSSPCWFCSWSRWAS